MYKNFLKNLFFKFGFIIARKHSGFKIDWVLDDMNQISTLELLIKYELLLNGTNSFNFVQFGANDGQQADPLSPLIFKYNLNNGLLVEPIPAIYKKLMNRYSSLSGLQFANIAIHTDDGEGEMPFYLFSSDNEQRQLELTGLSSTIFSKISNLKKQYKIKEEIKEIKVKYESVPIFLKKRNITSLSLLVTDIEGLDIDIILCFLDANFFPRIIYTEILAQEFEKIELLKNKLKESGYQIGGNISDLIAYRSF
jgi:FkbM family methyltransferase